MMYLLTLILLIVYIYLGLKKPAIALITCPFVAGTLFLYAAAEEDVAIFISAGIILLTTILAILFSKSDPEQPDWPKIITRMLIQFTLIVLLLITLFAISPPLGFIGLVFSIVLVGSVISYYITSRYAMSAYIISTIGSCIRQNLPLPMALETAASGRKDKRARILLNIKYWLVQGYSLSGAIRRGFRSCSSHAIAMITTAERINQLPLAIQAIETNMTEQAKERRKIKPIHPLYPLIIICFMFFILSGVFLFVMPQFSSVLSEMTEGSRLPAITRFMVDVARSPYFLIIISLILFILIPSPVIFFIYMYLKFRPRNSDEPYFLSIIGDKVKWYLPILHWFEKNYSMVQTIEMLRLSLNAGYPVNEAIANTITLDVNCCFKKRLRNWLEKVESGFNISESAEKCKLGSALAWAFDDKVNQGSTINILEALESFYRKNYSYCINLARFIFWPCIIILLGFLVSMVILAIFLPMIEIIDNLTHAVY